MKTPSIGNIKKKAWSTPSIQLIATGYINGGNSPDFREGAPTGNGNYNIYTHGIPVTVPKGIWSSAHS